MEQDAFDLVWVAAVLLGCIALPIVGGLVAVLSDRE